MLGNSNVGVTIAVSDLDAAKRFYGEVLGLEQVNEDPGGVSYKSGNSRVYVYPSDMAGTNKATYAGWSVTDIEAVVEELKAKGVSFEQYDDMPGVTRQGDIHVMGDSFKAAWFKDPTGNILALDNGEM
jgi:catechol 2,3-dioxygenase-like lactoylglutathione lyase family enzyme